MITVAIIYPVSLDVSVERLEASCHLELIVVEDVDDDSVSSSRNEIIEVCGRTAVISMH